MKKQIVTVLTGILLLAACSSGRESSAGDFAMMSKEIPSPSSSVLIEREEQPGADGTAAAGSGPQISSPAQRKRIYNGSAEIIVDKPEETRSELERIALESGGYIESSYSGFVALRIPSERFNSVFDTILTMGRVQSQEIMTWDVTEQFADTAQRLETAEKTRERLYELLRSTKDAKERARILKEIGRLSEEIEAVRQQLVLMESRIAFSRITVGIIPKLEDDTLYRDIPFPWIASLSPLSPASDKLKARISLNPGDAFAVFGREDFFMAENADGMTLSISTVENSPRGDNLFWQKALLFHLGDYYEEAEPITITLGNREFRGVRLISKDAEPYLYTAAVLADGKDLHVLEIFSPEADRDLSALYAALREGEIK